MYITLVPSKMNVACLFAAMAFFIEGYLCEKNVACAQRTLDGNCCQFPFYYKNTKYKSCTSHGDVNNRFWCATDYKYDKNHTEGWGYCKFRIGVKSQCFVRTTDGICCVFPFQYRGIEYTNCATSEGKSPKMHWCATQAGFDETRNGTGWGYCAGATCFTCRSTDSWKQCNINRVKKICPYGTEHCATFSGQESSNASSSNKKIFIKDCAAETDCYNSDRHCNKHTVLAGTCSYECCHGDLCNKGRSSKESVNVRLVLIITVFAAIKFYSKIT